MALCSTAFCPGRMQIKKLFGWSSKYAKSLKSEQPKNMRLARNLLVCTFPNFRETWKIGQLLQSTRNKLLLKTGPASSVLLCEETRMLTVHDPPPNGDPFSSCPSLPNQEYVHSTPCIKIECRDHGAGAARTLHVMLTYHRNLSREYEGADDRSFGELRSGVPVCSGFFAEQTAWAVMVHLSIESCPYRQCHCRVSSPYLTKRFFPKFQQPKKRKSRRIKFL